MPSIFMYNESTFTEELDAVLLEIRQLLIQKNMAYGDSALNPVRIFSKASASEQILVRIDDKLSRLSRGSDAGEDVILDLLGYLLLYRLLYNRNSKV